MLWGFGLWWAVFAGIVIYRQRRELHFQLPVWGASASPLRRGSPSPSSSPTIGGLRWLAVSGAVLWAALIVAFAVAMVMTVVRMPSGAMFGR